LKSTSRNVIFRYKSQLIACSILLNIIFLLTTIQSFFSSDKNHSNSIEKFDRKDASIYL